MEETPTPPASVKDLISRWRTRRVLASEIGENTDTVHKWALKNRIPTEKQAAVLEAARKKRIKGVTAQWMIDVHREVAA